MTHASESLHWYARDGSPAYTVKAKDGSDRPTTLRDARKLNLCPSVTSIIKCAAAPGLEMWKQNQVLLAALTLQRRENEPEAAYLTRILQDSKEQAKKAAERGSAIHAAIQGHYEGKAPSEEFWPHVKGTAQAVKEFAGGREDWVAEKSFSHPLGFGGKVDLLNEWDLVIDFKTKEFGPEDELKTWDEHAMQLAAYREGLCMPEAQCAIAYVSVTTPGLSRIIEIPEESLKKGWQMFTGLLAYWQAKSNYVPNFERKAA